METTSRTYPAINFAAFHNETRMDNNNLQVPTARMSPNGLMDWLHERAVRQPLQFSEKAAIISEEQVQTRKLLGLHITSQHKCCE